MHLKSLSEVGQREVMDSSLNYQALPSAPLATESMSTRVTTDQNQYTENQTIVVNIPATGQLLDTESSYLAMNVALGNCDGTNNCTLAAWGGVTSLINRVRVSDDSGKVLFDLQNSDYLMAILQECLYDIGSWKTIAPGGANSTNFFVTGQHSRHLFKKGIQTSSAFAETYHGAAGTASRTYVFNPLELLFQHKQLIPLYQALKIELTLNSNQTCLVQSAASSGSPNFTITNVKMVLKTIRPPDMVRKYINSLYKSSGLNINIVQAQSKLCSVDQATEQTLKVSTGGLRNVTSVILAPRLQDVAVQNYYKDPYRRVYIPYDRIYYSVGSQRSENFESNAELYKQLSFVFDNNLVGNLTDNNGQLGKYGVSLNSSGNIGSTSPSNASGLYFGGSSIVNASSHLIGFDMNSFNNANLYSGISSLPLDITYKTSQALPNPVRWDCFIINTGVWNISAINGSIVAN